MKTKEKSSINNFLSSDFFNCPTLIVAKDILGKYLIRKLKNKKMGGQIVEVEAYIGETDKACHASKGYTPRSSGLYDGPGHLYVYLIYGMYWCLNIVTESAGIPAAILIRAIEPTLGINEMFKYRHAKNIRELTNGPGKLCQALSITGALHRKHLDDGELVVEDYGTIVRDHDIIATPRIGVDYAGESAQLPWRFYIKNNDFVSKKNVSA